MEIPKFPEMEDFTAESSIVTTLMNRNGMSDGSIEIKFIDEGGGYFLEIETDIPLRLDATQLLSIGEWACKVVSALDNQNAEQRLDPSKRSD